jgi:hypothetical protein
MNSTAKTVIKWTGGLIALYLGLYYATGAGNLLKTGGGVYTGAVRTLQGR